MFFGALLAMVRTSLYPAEAAAMFVKRINRCEFGDVVENIMLANYNVTTYTEFTP